MNKEGDGDEERQKKEARQFLQSHQFSDQSHQFWKEKNVLVPSGQQQVGLEIQ